MAEGGGRTTGPWGLAWQQNPQLRSPPWLIAATITMDRRLPTKTFNSFKELNALAGETALCN